jgi:DNA (cytosine-5)-methyltransferase 1
MHKFPFNWKLKNSSFSGKKGKGTVFSCFACGGGSTMGYKLAGFKVLGCNEIDPKMMEVYKVNHNPKYAYLEPIQTFKLRKDLPKQLYNLDILDGSPPCSPFSMSGNREADWGKEKKFREGQTKQVLNDLFFDFIDLAKELQPKMVVAENVKGILMGTAATYKINYVDKIYKAFDEAGYYCKHWLLDASKMGVPQKRERVFFICLRKDLAKSFLVHKDFLSITPKLNLVFNERKIVFKDIKYVGERKPIQKAIEEAYYYCMKNKTADFAKYFEKIEGKRKYFNTRLLFNNRVCGTIKGDCTHVIAGEKAYINDEEIKRAGAFPVDYNFMNNKVSYLVGMSVPPVMMANIADRLYTQILSKCK